MIKLAQTASLQFEPERSLRWIRQRRLPFLAAALLACAAGQWLADGKRLPLLALASYLVGAILFGLINVTRVRERTSQQSMLPLSINRSLLLWAGVFAVLSFASFQDNRITAYGVMSWVLSTGLCFLAFGKGQVAQEHDTPNTCITPAGNRRSWQLSWPVLGLLAALALGSWLRLYELTELPADLGWDLPYNYSDAKRILNGEYFVFFPDNYGREGLFFYLIAGVSRLAGLSPYSIRLTSALVGIVTIPAIYALASECLDSESGAYAALLLAANRWHIALTRSGYRVSLMPLLSILVLYGLARALRRGRARDWFWCGLFLGLGLWSYKAFTFAVPVVFGSVGVYWLLGHIKRSQSDTGAQERWHMPPRRLFQGAALCLVVTVIVIMPMIRFIIDSPESYFAREKLGLGLVGQSLDEQGSTLEILGQNIVTSLLMFNYEGDGNIRFGVPYQRHLGYVSGIVLVLGLAIAVSKLRRGGNAMLVWALGIFLIPMTVSMLAGEKPNCFRSSGTIGPALVLGAMALRSLRQELSVLIPNPQTQIINLSLGDPAGNPSRSVSLKLALNLIWLPLAVIAMLLVAETRETSRDYWVRFRRVAPDIGNYSVALELAETIARFEDGPTYIKVWPYWYDGRAVSEHLDSVGKSWTAEIFEIQPDLPPLAGLSGKLLILGHPDDQESLATLKRTFTRWTVTTDEFPGGSPAYWAFYGEK